MGALRLYLRYIAVSLRAQMLYPNAFLFGLAGNFAANVVSIQWLAAALFVVLLSAWATVAGHTFRDSWSGRLFRAADAAPRLAAVVAAPHPRPGAHDQRRGRRPQTGYRSR